MTKIKKRLAFWGIGLGVILFLGASLFIGLRQQSHEAPGYAKLQERVASVAREQQARALEFPPAVLEPPSVLREPAKAGNPPPKLLAPQDREKTSFFALLESMPREAGHSFEIWDSPWHRGFGQWKWRDYGQNLSLIGLSSVKKEPGLDAQRHRDLERYIRKALTSDREPTPQETAKDHPVPPHVREEQRRRMRQWSDIAEKFLTQEPWRLPSTPYIWEPPFSANTSEAVQRVEWVATFGMEEVFSLAVRRAERRGETEKARRMFLRFADLLRYLHLSNYPNGSGRSRQGLTDFRASLFAVAVGESSLNEETFRRAAEVVESARLSPEVFHSLWPGYVHRMHAALIDAESTNWSVGRKSNTWHFFFSGNPEFAVTRVLSPIARRKIEMMEMGYAEEDDAMIARAKGELRAALSVMNVKYPDEIDMLMNDSSAEDEVTGYRDLIRGKGFYDTLDEIEIMLAFLRYRAAQRRNPQSMSDLCPAYLDRSVIERDGVSWECILVNAFSAADTLPRRVADEVPLRKLRDLFAAYKKDHGGSWPTTVEEIRPFVSDEAQLEGFGRFFVSIPETTVFIKTEIKDDGSESVTWRWPVFPWPDEAFAELWD